MKVCLVPLLIFLAITRFSAASENPAFAARPNIIAIVTDDQGRWAMGCYGNGEIHTPHLDLLAKEGVIFNRAFANTPVCSPSRATYLTGRYPTELGITDQITPAEAREGIGLNAPTWPAVLQRHGYRTALIGKWHLGERPEFHPTRHGFHHFVGFLGGGNRPMGPTLEVDGRQRKFDGPIPDILTDEAIAFLRASGGSPFALCLHFREPHTPYGPVPDEDSAHYRTLDPTVPMLKGLDIPAVKESTRAYYASVSAVDRNVGRLLRALDEMGLAEKTLVLFTSDHGYNEGRHYVTTKGNGIWIAGGIRGPTRPNMWDTSVQIPLVMRWPGVIRPGSRIDHMFGNIDVFRTVLGALNVPVPDGTKVHGTDFSPLLRGRDITRVHSIFGQFDLHNSALAYMRMIRTDRHKLVRFFHANSMDELYDLEKDPDEMHNLLGRGNRTPENTAIEQQLGRQLTAWMASIDDPLLRDDY